MKTEVTGYLILVIVSLLYSRYLYTEWKYRYNKKQDAIKKQNAVPRYKPISNNKKNAK